MTEVGFEPRPLAQESDALPLSHRAPPQKNLLVGVLELYLLCTEIVSDKIFIGICHVTAFAYLLIKYSSIHILFWEKESF